LKKYDIIGELYIIWVGNLEKINNFKTQIKELKSNGYSVIEKISAPTKDGNKSFRFIAVKRKLNNGGKFDDGGLVIDSLEELLELYDEGSEERIFLQNKINALKEKENKDVQPSYLMTLEEYKSSDAIPLLKEYRKFVKNNEKRLYSDSYGSIGDFRTLEEYIELGDKSPLYSTTDIMGLPNKRGVEETIKDKFIEQKTRYGRNPNDYEVASKEVIEQNKKFREKILKYFPLNKYGNIQIDNDELKSNKRAVRNAMEKNIYFNLIKDGKLSVDRLEEIADSVGVRITKETYSADKNAELKEYLKKIKVPQQNYEALLEFGIKINKDLQPIKETAYNKEYKRYSNNILESVGKTITSDRLSLLIPFWMSVVDVNKKEIKSSRGSYYTEYEYTILSVKSDWEKQLEKKVNDIIEELMFKIVTTIISAISFVKIPFKSVVTKEVKIGAKGFEGVYEINFTDGSKFDLVTQGIEAGGYNIQSFHYRYISKIEKMILPNGEETKDYSHFRVYKEIKTFADGGQVIDPNQQQVIYIDENGNLMEQDKSFVDKIKDRSKQGLNFIKEHPELLLKEGGAIDTITKLEIDAMKRSINDPNTSEYLKKTYNKILAKYDIDITKPIDKKYKEGKYIDTYDFSGYEYMKNKNEEAGVSFLLTGEYELVSKAIFEKDYSMWLFYNYLGRINISFQACKDWLKEATQYFVKETPVPINLTHTPKAKDGRSFALWYATSNRQAIISKFGDEKIVEFEYNGIYYYQEIGMVGNFDADNNDGWGTLYQEKKTGLLIPEFTQKSFHLNTLIHEFSHCLDFQTQLLINIDKYNLKKSQKDVSLVIDDDTTELEKQIYGDSLKSTDGKFVAYPITNHFEFFVDALIKILRACSSGKIPLTQLYEQQALDVQTTLSGVYGDLLLEQRERKRKEGVELKKQDELRENKRFTWQDKWVMDVKNYILKNAQQDGLKESLNSKSSQFTLSEIIELDNLINIYIDTEFRKNLSQNPTKAQSLVEPIKLMKKESNRIINNHYDNIKNKYEYGFTPQNDLDYYLESNCNYKDFKDYKDWKQCMISSLQSYK